jgi:uncharacterized repeat protein (TIGR04076 family)
MTKLKITVERIDGYCNMPMLVGDYFYVDDYKLKIPGEKGICMWALSSIIPLVPLINEQDCLSDDHWAKKVEHIACPDPKGKVIYRVEPISDDQD